MALKKNNAGKAARTAKAGQGGFDNRWKAVAIVFIALFILIVIGGFWRAYHLRPQFRQATDAEIAIAKDAATADLASRGENITGEAWKVSSDTRNMHASAASASRDILEVSISGEHVRYAYIIEIPSGNILLYSKTEFQNGLPLPPEGSWGMMPEHRPLLGMFGR